MTCEAFIVHLARATGRAAAVQAAVTSIGMPCKVVEAVDGQSLTPAELDAVYVPRGLNALHYPFALGRGEIACFMSHRKVWAEIVERRLDWGVVLEDDVAIDPDAIADVLSLVQTRGVLTDYVSLQTRRLPVGRTVYQQDACRLLRVTPPPLRTSGQIVGRIAAERLLEATNRFDRPIDVFLQMEWITKVPVLCADPSGVSDWPEPTGGSMAQSKRRRGLASILRRELDRTLYRRRIAVLARRNK